MTTTTKTLLEAYNIVAKFKIPQLSTFTIAAEDEEAARTLFKELTSEFENVEIVQIYNIKDVPSINEAFGYQQTPNKELN